MFFDPLADGLAGTLPRQFHGEIVRHDATERLGLFCGQCFLRLLIDHGRVATLLNEVRSCAPFPR